MKSLLVSAFWGVVLLSSCGCVFFRSPEPHMASALHPSSGPERARHLVLFMPGLGDSPEDVEKGGFVEAMKAAPQFDVVIADAHFGYYKGFTVLERVHEDVIEGLRPKYDEFWVVGVSMGGYGAASYAEKYRDEVTGVILMAPYLGKSKVRSSVKKDGGLLKWDPSHVSAKSDRTQHSVTLWTWFQSRAQHHDEPILILAAGKDDTLLPSLELLMPAVPKERIYLGPGGHEWTTWRPLFHEIVAAELKVR